MIDVIRHEVGLIRQRRLERRGSVVVRPLGDSIMKMLFVDEAGIANPTQEPVVTVGGVIVTADGTWKTLEVKLETLARQYLPEGVEINDFSFHATDLFSGGKFFPRAKYRREERWAILKELCQLPVHFELPLVCGYVRRSRFEGRTDHPPWLWAQGVAFHSVLQVTQDFMRKNTPAHEVASVIAEDNAQARQFLRFAQAHSQNRDAFLDRHADERDRLWLTRIMGEPSFQTKTYRSPLQLADILAFVLKRHLMKKADIRDFWELLEPCIANEAIHLVD